MAVTTGSSVNDARMTARPDVAVTVRAGLIGGFVGGVSIWIYEAIVWVGLQSLMPLGGIPRNATGLVFGKAVQELLGPLAYVLGTGIHFFFCFVWGVLFAFLWPYFRRRGYEATLVALFFAVILWIVMHSARSRSLPRTIRTTSIRTSSSAASCRISSMPCRSLWS